MRYFIVFFDGLYEDGHFRGHDVVSSDGFISRDKTEEAIRIEFGYSEVVITNILEISYMDWLDFLS